MSGFTQDATASLVPVVLFLAATAAVGLGLVVLRRYLPALAGGRRLVLVERLGLGPGTYIALVRHDEREYLIAGGQRGFELVASEPGPVAGVAAARRPLAASGAARVPRRVPRSRVDPCRRQPPAAPTRANDAARLRSCR